MVSAIDNLHNTARNRKNEKNKQGKTGLQKVAHTPITIHA